MNGRRNFFENHRGKTGPHLRSPAGPFKTALRSVSSVEDVIVEVHTNTGAMGYGEAPATGVITGDTTGAILGALRDHIIKAVTGRDVDDFEDLMLALDRRVVKNTSAIIKIDLDGPVLCSEDPILGGADFAEQNITVSDDPGLGIQGVQGLVYLN